MLSKENIVGAGKYLFLAAVAFLIIRNNSYPWVIKRSSDILFLLSALIVLYFIFRFREGYKKFLKNKSVWAALLFLSFGLFTASLNGYVLNGTKIDHEGILEIGRFGEVFLIIFLVYFFQNYDPNFYKKAAVAQLSTLAYLPMLFSSEINTETFMYRFQLFENWPSNVGYYLIVSISLTIALLLINRETRNRKFFWYYFSGIGLFGIIMWAQSRAAWLGLMIALLLLILLLAKGSFKKIISGLFIIFTMLILAFAILPTPVKNTVLTRIFPQLGNNIDLLNTRFAETAGLLAEKKPSSELFSESNRLELWNIYAEKLAGRPLGLGVSYEPVDIGHGTQGPHNTILEILVLAGPIGLFGLIYLFTLAFRNLKEKIKNAADQNHLWLVYVFSSIIGLAVAAFFDNMATFRLMWLLLGMSLAL